MVIVFAWISLQTVVPLFRYLLFKQSYIYECQVVLKHQSHHSGECKLNRELAAQNGSRNDAGVIHVKMNLNPDIFFETLKNSVQIKASKVIYYTYQDTLASCDREIIAPPPNFFS